MDGLLNFDVRTRAASSTPCMNVGDGWIDVLMFKFENERRGGWVHGDLGGTFLVASSSNWNWARRYSRAWTDFVSFIAHACFSIGFDRVDLFFTTLVHFCVDYILFIDDYGACIDVAILLPRLLSLDGNDDDVGDGRATAGLHEGSPRLAVRRCPPSPSHSGAVLISSVPAFVIRLLQSI
jgi:hypothetical protein